MLNIKFIRENLEEVKKALAKKHTKFDLDKLLKLDDERKGLLGRVEELRAKRNEAGTGNDARGCGYSTEGSGTGTG